MASLLSLLASVPGLLASFETILAMLTKYFPAKTEGERAVDKQLRKTKAVRRSQRILREKIKEAKLGKVKRINDALNS